MNCAWKELMAILPLWCRTDVDQLGQDTLQELRLRLGFVPELIRCNGNIRLKRAITSEDLSYIVNTASRYSPWTAATSAQGYITAPGGHRIGICGQAVVQDGKMTGFRQVRSLCIRVARDFPGIAKELQYFKDKGIRVMILEIPTTTQDLSSLDNSMAKMIMETINNMLIELYATMAQAEIEKKDKRQQEGIEAKKARGEWADYGRPKAEKPSNWGERK